MVAILRWLQAVGIETAFIDPGKPWQPRWTPKTGN
jgi:hypothetical protein